MCRLAEGIATISRRVRRHETHPPPPLAAVQKRQQQGQGTGPNQKSTSLGIDLRTAPMSRPKTTSTGYRTGEPPNRYSASKADCASHVGAIAALSASVRARRPQQLRTTTRTTTRRARIENCQHSANSALMRQRQKKSGLFPKGGRLLENPSSDTGCRPRKRDVALQALAEDGGFDLGNAW